MRWEACVILFFVSLGRLEVEVFGREISMGGNPHKLVPICLVTAALAWFFTRRAWLIGSNPLSRFVLAYSVATCLSVLFALDRYGTAKDIFKILMCVAFFDLICQIFPTLESARSLAAALLLGYSVLVCVCALELLQGAWRISGPLRYPTILGGYLVMVLPLLLARLMYLRTQLSRSLCLLLFASGVLILLGTLSRGAYAGFLAGLLVLIVITREKRLVLMFFVGLLLVLPAVYGKVQSRVAASYKDVFVLGTVNRKNIWMATWDMLKDPKVALVGLGMGDSYSERFEQFSDEFHPGEPKERVAHPHNLFLYQWVSGGIIGLLAFLYLLAGIAQLVRFLVHMAVHDKDRWIVGALAASITGVLVQNLVDCTLWRRSLTMLFWTILSAVVIQARKSGVSRIP